METVAERFGEDVEIDTDRARARVSWLPRRYLLNRRVR
jgi:hypothetical protein